MIFDGPESNKALKRDNVLDVFCAAQFLCIKDLEEQCWSFIINENLFSEDTAFTLYREARVKGLTPVMDLMVSQILVPRVGLIGVGIQETVLVSDMISTLVIS